MYLKAKRMGVLVVSVAAFACGGGGGVGDGSGGEGTCEAACARQDACEFENFDCVEECIEIEFSPAILQCLSTVGCDAMGVDGGLGKCMGLIGTDECTALCGKMISCVGAGEDAEDCVTVCALFYTDSEKECVAESACATLEDCFEGEED